MDHQQYPAATTFREHLEQLPQAMGQIDDSQITKVGQVIEEIAQQATQQLEVSTDQLSTPQQGQSSQLAQLPRPARQSYSQLMTLASRPARFVPERQQPQINPVFETIDQQLQQRMAQVGAPGFGQPGQGRPGR